MAIELITPEFIERVKELHSWATGIYRHENNEARLHKGYGIATFPGVRINKNLELWEDDDDMDDDTWSYHIKGKELFYIHRYNGIYGNKFTIIGIDSIPALHAFEKIMFEIEKCKEWWTKEKIRLQEKAKRDKEALLNEYAPIPDAKVVEPLRLTDGKKKPWWKIW